MEDEIEKVKELLAEAYRHLNYCNYGDSWERECAEELRKDLDKYFQADESV